MSEKEFNVSNYSVNKQDKKEPKYSKTHTMQYQSTLQDNYNLLFNNTRRHCLNINHLQWLKTINQDFSVKFCHELFSLVQYRTKIIPEEILIQPYYEFTMQLCPPISLNIINLKSLQSNILFAIMPELIFALLNILFGGNVQLPNIQGREFSSAEKRIISRLLKLILKSYSDSWMKLHLLKKEEYSTKEAIHFSNIFRNDEIVIVSSFRVCIGDVQGKFAIIFSQKVIELLYDLLNKQSLKHTHQNHIKWRQNLANHLQETKIDISVRFNDLSLCLSRVISIQHGDILLIPHPHQLTAYINNVPIFIGSYGSLNGQYALHVKHVINQNINQLNS